MPLQNKFPLILLSLGLAISGSVTVFAQSEAGKIHTKPVLKTGNSLQRILKKKKFFHKGKPGLIRNAAHGLLLSGSGRSVNATPEIITYSQKYYLQKLAKNIEKDTKLHTKARKIRSLIYRLVTDKTLANALYIDWLLDNTKHPNVANIRNINAALRNSYILDIAKSKGKITGPILNRGISSKIGKVLAKKGITVSTLTKDGGAKYIDECRRKGVPIPPDMFSNQWEKRLSPIESEFIEDTKTAQLWFYESQNPLGACLALPRYAPGSNKAAPLGIICLGRSQNHACFWDNPKGKKFKRDEKVSIDKFLGGADLATNGQGTCTDCHAGENPFVVHPDKAAFDGDNNNNGINDGGDQQSIVNKLMAGGWHKPLVHPDWPQNPGPSNFLDGVTVPTGKKACTSCHRPGSAGRFPEVSTKLKGYCNSVLKASFGKGTVGLLTPTPNRPDPTMPRPTDKTYATEKVFYASHIAALKRACTQVPNPGVVIDTENLPDNPDVVSRPLFLTPFFGCATKIAVRGAVLDATLKVSIENHLTGNVTLVASVVSRSTTQVIIDVPALVAKDTVFVTQTVNGVESDKTGTVVLDHNVAYPNGLPDPEIDPTLIYQCASKIAVRHVPGAKLTVFVNGANPRTISTGSDWTAIRPGKTPFEIGDKFTAKINLCQSSSATVQMPVPAAIRAPANLVSPIPVPAETYEGQELLSLENMTHGAETEIQNLNTGQVGSISSWPISWYPDFDITKKLGAPLSAGQTLKISHSLCEAKPVVEVGPALSCRDLSAPRIRRPYRGDSSVIVQKFVPGARIRVYDAPGNELGDGAGTVITLNRALTGQDTVTVVQQLRSCTSRNSISHQCRQ